ncbi:MAG: hypothetical protein Q6K92_11680, partial [Thermostichus sp. DG_1_5_bins_95]
PELFREAGTVYSLDQLGSLADLAHRFGLHRDGACFAHALAQKPVQGLKDLPGSPGPSPSGQ